MHVVLGSDRAKGPWSLKRADNDAKIRDAMRDIAKRHKVKVYELANGGSNLHLLLHAKRREDFQRFLRAFAGISARLVTGARKGNPVGKFWDGLAYSRVIEWGDEFKDVRNRLSEGDLDGFELPSRPSKRKRRVAPAPAVVSGNGRAKRVTAKAR
jgi:REP element-mobilizing transposase RayT